MEILTYHFMQNAIFAAFLAGVACSLMGVFVVLMRLSFIGVCLSHAAFAGALFAVLLGFSPMLGALLFSFAAAGFIGPLADRGQIEPDAAIGIVFSLMLGLAFLFIGLMPGPRSPALGLLWGSILTVTDGQVAILGVVCAVVVSGVVLFFKELHALIFNREVALAVGIPAGAIFYGLLFLTGASITASLQATGGLLIFGLIINPAAAAYQLTYSLRRIFFLAALFGVLSGWLGLAVSYMLDIPSGATIIIISCLIFGASWIFSPKRRLARSRTQNGW